MGGHWALSVLCPRISSSMHSKLRSADAWDAQYETKTKNLESPNSKPDLPCRHALAICVAPAKNLGNSLSPEAGQSKTKMTS